MTLTVTFDPTVKGLDKVNALSVLHELAPAHSDQKESVQFVEETSADNPVAQGDKGAKVAEGLVSVFNTASRYLGLHGNDEVESKIVTFFIIF
jgi:hypothetical protein